MPAKTPKIEALVVNAIRRLQDVQGSTSREISNYISQEYDLPGKEIRRQVQVALRRGLSYGILQQMKGGYYACNRDYLQHVPCLGCETGDGLVEPCAKQPWRRRGIERARRRRRRRSRLARERRRRAKRRRSRRRKTRRRNRRRRRTGRRRSRVRRRADSAEVETENEDEEEEEEAAAAAESKRNDGASKGRDTRESETSVARSDERDGAQDGASSNSQHSISYVR